MTDSVAPNFNVPENVSPFVPLPQLALCAECGKPFEPLQAMSVVSDGRVRHGLCPPCATPPATNCPDCGHRHTANGCSGDPTPSDLWAGVSPAACDCRGDKAVEMRHCDGCGEDYNAFAESHVGHEQD